MAAEWYYRRAGEQNGPITGGELKRLAMAGRLSRTDLVWREGLPKWVAASLVPGLVFERELDVFELAEEPEPAVPASKPPVDARQEPRSAPTPTPRRADVTTADDAGLGVGRGVLFGLLFACLPVANVLLSSILFYVWRGENPKRARQINTLGFVAFGAQLLTFVLYLALTGSRVGGVADRLEEGPVLSPPADSFVGAGLGTAPTPGADSRTETGQVYSSRSGVFEVHVPATWATAPSTFNPDAEAAWALREQDAFAMAIFQSQPVPIEELMQAVLTNLNGAGANPQLLVDTMRPVGQTRVGELEFTCTLQQGVVHYLGRYHTDRRGSLQLVVFAPEALFETLRPALVEFLDGLRIVDDGNAAPVPEGEREDAEVTP